MTDNKLLCSRRIPLPKFTIVPTLKFSEIDLYKVPFKIFKKFFGFVKKQQNDPTVLSFPSNNIKPLKGYIDLFRLRIGDHRLIYRNDNGRIICLNIGKRGEIYNSIKYDPDREMIFSIAPNLHTYIEIESNSHVLIDKSGQGNFTVEKTQLSSPITLIILRELEIEEKYYNSLEGIMTEEDLFNLEGIVPTDILIKVHDKIRPAQTEQEKQKSKKVREEIKNLFQFSCPIEGCEKIFYNTRSGWDSHVESVNKHKNWHPDVVDGKERKRLFREEFSNWFGFTEQGQKQAQPIITSQDKKSIKQYNCPIDGCGKVFKNTRGGWDSHAASMKTHPNWHPTEKDGKSRKRLFKEEFPDWFK